MARSAGFTFLYVGGLGRSFGRRPLAALIAVCTSVAAPSIARLRSNCRVIEVLPSPLVEFIEARPGMAANCCSSGVATEEAIVSGLAPGRVAETVMVGKSTLGRADTGRRL